MDQLQLPPVPALERWLAAPAWLELEPELAAPELLAALAALEGGLRLLELEPDPALLAALRRSVKGRRVSIARAWIAGRIGGRSAALELLPRREGREISPAQVAELRLRWSELCDGGELEEILRGLEPEGAPMIQPEELAARGALAALERLEGWLERDLRGELALEDRLLLRAGCGGLELRLLAALLRSSPSAHLERERLAALALALEPELAALELTLAAEGLAGAGGARALLALLLRGIVWRAGAPPRAAETALLFQLRRAALAGDGLALLPVLRALEGAGELELEDLRAGLAAPEGERLELEGLRVLIPILRRGMTGR